MIPSMATAAFTRCNDNARVTSLNTQPESAVIFCKTVNDIVSLLTHFLMRLRTTGSYTDGDEPAHERCLLGVYYSQTPKNPKESVTFSFEGLHGKFRLVFASTSLSMGVDFPHVRYVIHYGLSRNLTSHLQEAGRGGSFSFDNISWATPDCL